MNEHFHSVHGAIQESMHVFIGSGLEQCTKDEITIFEVGFGTGLNALLSLMHRGSRQICYYSIERYPLSEDEYSKLNFATQLSPDLESAFLAMHRVPWNESVEIKPGFSLCKIDGDLPGFDPADLPLFDLIYFDAFAPDKQAEMWEEAIFAKLSAHTNPGGVFVTYCAKGEVRRRLTRSGFTMKRIPGPPGKKEMLFGQKIE